MSSTVHRQLEIMRRLAGKDRDEQPATEGDDMTTWKDCERRIAQILGGERVPVTGRQRGDAPDISHPWLSLEVKHRKALPGWLLDAMRQAQASKRDGQLPAVILHGEGMDYRTSMVLVRLDDFVDWISNNTPKEAP